MVCPRLGGGTVAPIMVRVSRCARYATNLSHFLDFFGKFFDVKPYEGLVQFIASLSPHEVIDFKPSESARQQVWELIERKKTSPLPVEEESELNHYLEIEHLMRLAKARARQLLAHGH